MKEIRYKKIPEILFYIAIMIELAMVILDKSAYIIRYEGYWFRLIFALFSIKAVCNKYTLRQWLGLVLAGVIAVISYKVTGRNEMLRIVVLIAACKDVEGKKLLKLIFWTTLIGCVAIMLLSLIGIGGVVAYTDEFRVGKIETRYCFGMGHPNSFHGMLWALITLGCYLFFDKFRLIHYMILFIANVMIYFLSLSRTAVLLTAMVIVLYAVLHCCKKIAKRKLFYIGCVLVILASVVITIVLCETVYTSPLVAKINEKLSLRIFGVTWTENAMPEEWTLFGLPENTKYFDMGIARLFYWYGWIPALLYLVMNIHLIYVAYKKQDGAMAVLVSTIMIYTIMEAHVISDYLLRNYIYVLYGLALTIPMEEKATKREYYCWDIGLIRRGVKSE